jgi:hypothetical protein
VGLKLNGTHQLLTYADDVNLLGNNINTINKNKETLIDASKPITYQDLIQEEIKKILNSGNACYHSVQNLLFSRLLSRNVKVRIYKTIIFPVVLYGCETWSLTAREEHKLRMFENRMPKRIFGPKWGGVMGSWRKLHNEELNLYTSPSIQV